MQNSRRPLSSSNRMAEYQASTCQHKVDTIGYDCEFVRKPQDAFQTECPFCLHTLRDPYQVRCCGKCFCRACYKRLQASNMPCPTCKNPAFSAFKDKRQKQTLSQLHVYCTHKGHGCKWTGELGDLERHLNQDPKEGAEKNGCAFVQIGCIYCFDRFERRSLDKHPFDQCPKRRIHCTNDSKGCKWQGELRNLKLHLQTTCSTNLVTCPNKCGKCVHYLDLDSHKEESCSMTIIDCDFKSVGCNKRLPRKHMPKHLKESSHCHMMLLMETSRKLEAQNENLKAQVEKAHREKASLIEVQQIRREYRISGKWLCILSSVAVVMTAFLIGNLQSQLAIAQKQLNVAEQILYDVVQTNPDQLTKYNPTYMYIQQGFTLHEFILSEFSKCQAKGDFGDWYSEPFYSHPGGYKFKLRVDTNGVDSVRGVYVSVWFYLLQGDHDNKLEWPITITAHVQLINQLGDHGHFNETFAYTAMNGDVYKWDRGETGGWGYPKFIKLTQLGLNADKNTQYLKNDRLEFTVYFKTMPRP